MLLEITDDNDVNVDDDADTGVVTVARMVWR